MSARLAIGNLSKQTGCNVETIRYYERVGLLPAPTRSDGGYRLYATEHLQRLTFIRRARALGFSISEVRTLLRLADERERSCARARVVAAAHLEDVRAKIADLRVMEHVLKETVARCADGKGSDCPLIEALYHGEPDRSRDLAAVSTPDAAPQVDSSSRSLHAHARLTIRRRTRMTGRPPGTARKEISR